VHGLTEVLGFLPLHTPIERFTDVGAIQPKLDMILIIGYGILEKHQPEVYRLKTGSHVP